MKKTSLSSLVLALILISCSEDPDRFRPIREEQTNGNVRVSNSEFYDEAQVRFGTQQQLEPNFEGALSIHAVAQPIDRLSGRSNLTTGAALTSDQWERLLAGEELQLFEETDTRGGVTSYNDTNDVSASKMITHIRLERIENGQLRAFIRLDTWRFVEPEWREHEEKVSEVVVTFIPEFVCGICINEPPEGCIGGFDPNNESEYCSSFVEEFRLRELGLVD